MPPVFPAVDVVVPPPNEPKLNPADGADDAGVVPKLPKPEDAVEVVGPNPK